MNLSGSILSYTGDLTVITPVYSSVFSNIAQLILSNTRPIFIGLFVVVIVGVILYSLIPKNA